MLKAVQSASSVMMVYATMSIRFSQVRSNYGRLTFHTARRAVCYLSLTMPIARFSKASSRANSSMVARRRARIVALVESLPEATVTVAGDRHLSLEVRGKRFGYYLDDHHGDGRVALNCKAEPGANQSLTDFAPERFHIPAYLGSRGWIGLWIDLPKIAWDEVQSIVVDAYRLTAPKRLVAQLDGGRFGAED